MAAKYIILLCYVTAIIYTSKADQYPSYPGSDAPQCVKDKWQDIDKEKWDCRENYFIISIQSQETKKRIICCFVSRVDKCRTDVFNKYCGTDGATYYNKWKQPWDEYFGSGTEAEKIYKSGCNGYDVGSAKCNSSSSGFIFNFNLLIITIVFNIIRRII